MKKFLVYAFIAASLSACASNSSTGNSEMYGQVSSGVEHSRTF